MEPHLERVPFSATEEGTIASMARWMRFIAVLGIVGAVLMLFLVVVGVGLLSAARGMAEASPRWAEAARFAAEHGPIVYFLLAVFLLAAIVGIWQNFALYHAGEFFNLAARTDGADVDYLAGGLDKLRTYFKLQVLTALVTVAVAFGTAATYVAISRPLT